MQRYGTKDKLNRSHRHEGVRLGVDSAKKKNKTSLRMKMKKELKSILK